MLNIPERFETWDEFARSIPPLSRTTLKRNLEDIAFGNARADYWRTTGGSTAQPIRLPAWRHEDRITSRNTWLARNWFGVDASDRLFLIWGHTHLFGEGTYGRLNAVTRRAKDQILGYLRFSAYNLSEEQLRIAGKKLLSFKPGYVLGYSGALHRLAQVNEDLRSKFRALGLKVAIATGESFPSPESPRLIADVLGCPVVMEYGAVETGTIAHQDLEGRFRVFWNSYLVERLPSSDAPGSGEIAITALYPRLTPLVRYRLGDLIASIPDEQRINLSFDKIIGRCNDGIRLEQDDFIHSESFSHVLRDIPDLDTFQVIQSANREVTITYVSNSPLSGETLDLIRNRLCKVHPRLYDTRFRKVPTISETVAGKSKRIISEITLNSDSVDPPG